MTAFFMISLAVSLSFLTMGFFAHLYYIEIKNKKEKNNKV